jgi:hypothetical protein
VTQAVDGIEEVQQWTRRVTRNRKCFSMGWDFRRARGGMTTAYGFLNDMVVDADANAYVGTLVSGWGLCCGWRERWNRA